MKSLLILASIVLLSIIGVQSSFAEQSEIIPSPRQQLESGILPENIICKENRVLVLRDNGNPACITEKTAEKLSWEIIQTEFKINSTNEEIIIRTVSVESKLIESTPSENISNSVKEKIPWLINDDDSSYLELGKIPNPTGYWTPISKEQKEEFTNLLDAATEKATNAIGKTINHHYLILGESFTLRQSEVVQGVFINKLDRDEMEVFVENFMQTMNFQYTDNDVTVIEKLHGFTGTAFSIQSNDYSEIAFNFSDLYDQNHITISLRNWTNNPELVPKEFPLSSDDAINKVLEYVLNHDQLHLSPSQYEGISVACQFEFSDEPFADEKIYISSGVPYYKIDVGKCTYFDKLGNMQFPIFLIDAWNGEDIIYNYLRDQD
jgi:hypothetical protein